MSVSFSASEIVGMIAGSSLLSSLGVALVSRRRDTFAVFTEAYEALAGRVTTLERKLADVEVALGNERSEHERTRSLLRLAIDHIRAVVAWGAGDRSRPLPEPPAELMVTA